MPLPDTCPGCSFNYDDLRTGYTFAEVRAMLWIDSSNPEDWRYKMRGSVLGFWRELKQAMWKEHLDLCKEAENDPLPF